MLGKLKPEFKKQWLEALRSGNYKQSDGALRRSIITDNETIYRYCCLGVAVDITKASKRRKEEVLQHYKIPARDIAKKWWEKLPPNDRETNPLVVYKKQHVSLSDLNDEYMLSFKQIANIIERQL